MNVNQQSKKIDMCHFFIFIITLFGSAAHEASAQSAFPSVPPAIQQERDATRREILTIELSAEQAALAAARGKWPADPLAAHRHELNVAALQRELGATSGGAPLRVKVRAVPVVPTDKRRIEDPAPFWDVYRRVTTPSTN